MMWGVGILIILAGTLMIVYAMQGSPVIAPISLPSHLGPVGEGTQRATPAQVEVYQRGT